MLDLINKSGCLRGVVANILDCKRVRTLVVLLCSLVKGMDIHITPTMSSISTVLQQEWFWQ